MNHKLEKWEKWIEIIYYEQAVEIVESKCIFWKGSKYDKE